MVQTKVHDRIYAPLDLDQDFDRISERMEEEVAELQMRGKGICYADPSNGGRVVREYPDGRKVFVAEAAKGQLVEFEIDHRAKAA